MTWSSPARVPRPAVVLGELELDHTVALRQRRPVCSATAAGIAAALTGARQCDAEQLLLSIIAVVVGWTTLSRVSDAVIGDQVEPVSVAR